MGGSLEVSNLTKQKTVTANFLTHAPCPRRPAPVHRAPVVQLLGSYRSIKQRGYLPGGPLLRLRADITRQLAENRAMTFIPDGAI